MASKYNWRIHHGAQGHPDWLVVEVAPWKGLLPRWRFVLPAEYDGVVGWGQGDTNRKDEFQPVSDAKTARGGPVQMINGPRTVWFGGLDPLSNSSSAFLVLKTPPHYVMFGQAPTPVSPPGSMEGITFAADETHDHGHELHPTG